MQVKVNFDFSRSISAGSAPVTEISSSVISCRAFLNVASATGMLAPEPLCRYRAVGCLAPETQQPHGARAFGQVGDNGAEMLVVIAKLAEQPAGDRPDAF